MQAINHMHVYLLRNVTYELQNMTNQPSLQVHDCSCLQDSVQITCIFVGVCVSMHTSIRHAMTYTSEFYYLNSIP